MLGAYERRRFQTELINEMPLYPTERLLWDEHQIPSVNYTGVLPAAPQLVAPRHHSGSHKCTKAELWHLIVA